MTKEWPPLDDEDWNDFLAPDDEPEFDKEEYYRQKYEKRVADDLCDTIEEIGWVMKPGFMRKEQAG